MTLDTKKEEDFSEWFNELIEKVDILDKRYPIQGMPVYKEWGFKIARTCTRMLEELLETTNHRPMLFPVLISEDSFQKEKDHLEGLAGEVFWISNAGVNTLERRMLLRPTSETAMYPLFSLWIRTHADLPLKIHQSVTVYRYETKHTRPLFRGREFLWNEAHTAHATDSDAEHQVKEATKIYTELFKEKLGIEFLLLQRPDYDKFPGADYSLAFDAFTPNGRVNQVGTIHNLGKNFSIPFDIKYIDENGTANNVIQTCYGVGISRTLAAIISQFADNEGLILPPEVAPIQIVIVPIFYEENTTILERCKKIAETLKSSYRITIDDRAKIRPGAKYYHWEERGVPFRIEIGPKDIEKNQVTLVDRISKKKIHVAVVNLEKELKTQFSVFLENLKEKTKKTFKNHILDVKSIDELKDAIINQFVARACWCEKESCAERIEVDCKAEIRGHTFLEQEIPDKKCLVCQCDAKKVVYIAKAY